MPHPPAVTVPDPDANVVTVNLIVGDNETKDAFIEKADDANKPFAETIYNTINELAAATQDQDFDQDQSQDNTPIAKLKLISSTYTLLPSTQQPPSESARTYLQHLLKSAQEIAASSFQNSLLAGGTSETDDYADVTLWIGEKDKEKLDPIDVVNVLGVRLDERTQISAATPLTSKLPTSLRHIPESSHLPSHTQLSTLLSQLSNTFEFTFSSPKDDITHLHFLIGKFSDKGKDKDNVKEGWCGLVGVSIQADYSDDN
jgi:hypothetical protein